MKTFNCLGISLLAFVFATAGLTGCKTGDRYTQSTGEYIDDLTVTHRVKDALENAAYKYPDVNVVTFKGAVQLSGFVEDGSEKDMAGSLAKNVPGVKDVINNISVKSRQTAADVIVEDGTLTKRVKDALDEDTYKYAEVLVTSFKGTVQLSGFVDQRAQKDKAGDLAKTVPGVKEVVNNITVKPGA